MSGSWTTPSAFREFLDRQIQATPELFPPEIHRGYRMKDLYPSRKTGWKLRRIDLRNHQCYSGPPLLPDALPLGPTPRTSRPPFSPQVRRPVLGTDRGLRPLADVLVSPGTLAGPVQPGRDDRPGGRPTCPATWSPTRSTPPWPRQDPQGLPGGHRRGRVLPGDGPGRDGRRRRLDRRLRRVPGRGPAPGPGVPARRRSTPTAGRPPRRPGGRCSRA